MNVRPPRPDMPAHVQTLRSSGLVLPDAHRGPRAMIRKPISADSHITEPPNCYVDYIDPGFRERAPRIRSLEGVGDAFVIEGMATPVPLGLLAAAGKEPSKITSKGV